MNLYIAGHGFLHRLDERAKLTALAGLVLAGLLVPARPQWPWLVLLGILAATAAAGRLPVKTTAGRLTGLIVILGGPLLLTRLGGPDTQLAGEVFAVKSFLVAGSFVVYTATTRPEAMIDAFGRVPLLRGMGALSAFILRGVHILHQEVVRTNRAWTLRAPGAGPATKVRGLAGASISLLGRAAVRSERMGAAMVLRGFDGRFPPAPPRPLARGQLAGAVAFALACLAVGGIGRWL
jgi:energy-coupling factor transporter transmembrane protein EcfT